MRRAPFVVAATGVGLGLVLSYQTRPIGTGTKEVATAPTTARSAAGSSSSTTVTSGGGSSSSTTVTSGGGSSSSTTVTSGGGSSSSTTATPSTTAPKTRSAAGQDVAYRYGDLQLKVTEDGSNITAINVVSDGASDPRSEQINSQALPQLQSEALSAQSANIDGVSGATFTTMAYEQALQSALDQLGT